MIMELPIKVEGIIFKKENGKIQYLLLKRISQDGGFWQPMTGTVRDGEKVKDCLIRETEEETSIVQYVQIIENIHTFEYKNSENKTITEYVFGIEVNDDAGVKISDEHDEFEWCSFKNALEKLEKSNNKDAFIKLDRILKL